MIQPRGTFVVVDLIEQAERMAGAITVPTLKDKFCEATVMAVGPGNSMAGGARAETFDLQPGQKVMVNHKTPARNAAAVNGMSLELNGIPYHDDGKTYLMVEERFIVGILAPASDTLIN